MENKHALEDILLESEVMEFLGVNKQNLDSLRYSEKLPFLKINTRNRMYLKSDLSEFLIKRRIVLNIAEDDAE